MEYIDQIGRSVKVEKPPMRIISLVPSQTELLFDLGLGDRIVGITKFCIHPKEWHQTKPRVGGTKTLDFQKISDLKPDLIIGNKEENTEEEIEQLSARFPVWMSDIVTFEDAIHMISDLGGLLDVKEKAQMLILDIRNGFDGLEPISPPVKTIYLIWNKPFMAVGSDTFIDTMMSRIGLVNPARTFESRYPSLTIEEIKLLDPDLVLLSSEPFPFNAHHAKAIQEILPSAKIELVDGEIFSWYGSRLIQAPAYLNGLKSRL